MFLLKEIDLSILITLMIVGCEQVENETCDDLSCGNGYCITLNDSAVTCICNAGYSFDGVSCVESEESCKEGDIKDCNCSGFSSHKICNNNGKFSDCYCEVSTTSRGKVDIDNEFPFVVDVNHTSSGVLIDSLHILTSAHGVTKDQFNIEGEFLFNDATPLDTEVKVYIEGEEYLVSQIIIHPDFYVSFDEGKVKEIVWPDIAILQLSRCVSSIKAIHIANKKAKLLDNLYSVGYGKENCNSDTYDEKIIEEYVGSLVLSDYIKIFTKNPIYQGDSGGGLFKKLNNKYLLLGITSQSSSCTVDFPIDFNSYTNILTWKDWVEKQLLNSSLQQQCNIEECELSAITCNENNDNTYQVCKNKDSNLFYNYLETKYCDSADLLPLDKFEYTKNESILFRFNKNDSSPNSLSLIIKNIETGKVYQYENINENFKLLNADIFETGTYSYFIKHTFPCNCDSELGFFQIIEEEYSDCEGGTSKICGNCGVQFRTCDSGSWSSWSTCQDEGVCSSGTNENCGSDGVRYCSNSCQWGECIGECNDTCVSLGKECGTSNICGESINCGGCYDGKICNNSNTCVSEQICFPNEVSSRSCNISHGTGTQYKVCNSQGTAWTSYSNCNLVFCDNGYMQSGNNCLENCSSDSKKQCYNGDVYYYDSCNNRGEKYKNCSSDEECINISDNNAKCQIDCSLIDDGYYDGDAPENYLVATPHNININNSSVYYGAICGNDELDIYLLEYNSSNSIKLMSSLKDLPDRSRKPIYK